MDGYREKSSPINALESEQMLREFLAVIRALFHTSVLIDCMFIGLCSSEHTNIYKLRCL